MSNKAQEVIIPKEAGVFRVIFLYVGQGDSTLLIIPSGDSYKYVLVDSNNDEETGGIEIVRLLKDLFADTGQGLDVYVNTHPHKDHLGKILDIYNEVGISQLWHSGHTPGSEHKSQYEDLEKVMKKLGEKNVFRLRGSEEDNRLDKENVKIGDITYNVLAPADYVSADIEGEKPEQREARIHEQCGVIRFRYGEDEKQVLLTGDADYSAWKEHITKYHQKRLPSTVLSAAHHGSNSFFWKDSKTDEEPYMEHLNQIAPTYITVSAPKPKESAHNHPDKEAMELYASKVGRDSLFHMGEKRECIIVDIAATGEIELIPDEELVGEYGKHNGDDGGGGKKKSWLPPPVSRIDRKPMGD